MDPQQQSSPDNMKLQQGNLSQLSEAERQIQFRKQHQEYIAEKLARKRKLMEQIKAEFGSSSSDDSDQGEVNDKPVVSSVNNVKEKQMPKFQNHQKKMILTMNKFLVIAPVKKATQWEKQALVINTGKSIVLNNFTYEFKNINKIKIIAEPVMGISKKIKINYLQSQFHLASSANEEIYGIPSHYLLLSKLFEQKIISMGLKLKEYSHVKTPGVPQALMSNAYIYGKLIKKSQILGKWEERFIVINKDGIFSYRKFNEKWSIFIPNGSIKQLWSRFDFQDNMLIVKIHFSGKKTEFGLPICSMINTENWLFNFYNMMSKK